MTIIATVIRVSPQGMLVRNTENNQEIFVNYGSARLFRSGDIVRITSTGTMTFSIPPQITAVSVVRLSQPQPQPEPPTFTEITRARIRRISPGVLYVTDLSNNQPVIVQYPRARRFRVGQIVTVRYETVFLGNHLRVIATSVFPTT